MQNVFHGLGIALITPFKEDFSIDYEALENLVNYHLDNGADFFCILATTGESPCIAKASPLPIVLYNVPGRVGVNMTAETTVRIASEFTNVVAIKEASGNLEQVDEIIKNKPKHFEVISGDDALTFPMIASGAVGVISVIGNALPKEFSRMIRLEFKGEYEPARKIHHQFTELYKLLFVDGNPAGCKALLNDMGMIENVLRLPLVPTRIETKQKMNEILKGMRI